MHGYDGTDYLTVDSKGRMTIPAKYRDDFKSLVLMKSLGKDEEFIVIYTESGWNNKKHELDKSITSAKRRKIRKAILSKVSYFELDSSYRILLPKKLRDDVGITKKIALIGNDDRLEIWDEHKWELELESEILGDDYEDILEEIKW